jgi:uncharacterized protein (TIGR02058 family)
MYPKWKERAMSTKRILLEVGTGNDWHGGDYTKAAVRAVEDAIHHSSLTFLHTLNIDPRTMVVAVTIGVQQPEKVNSEVVKAMLPEGQVTVNAVKGGLDVPNRGPDDVTVIANAAIAVHLDLGR